jgi:hypothetical protein
MTINKNIEMLQEEYVLKRLVYVNSANHGYSEILLNNHMAMFGENNAGKTASLAGTKLLLFPEVNLHNCESKFKFEGKRGLYSTIESYEFYFPDTKSFLALEVGNPEGNFCMILYKTNNYAYGRFFVPLPYDEVRHLFWDSPAETFANDLGIQRLSKFVKDNNGIQITDPKEIAYLMFSSFRDDKSKKRFCILPLKDGRSNSIEAFKSIYQLAFETGNTEADALPEALATLLEMGRSRDEERLDANLKQITEEHSQLVKKQEWLKKLSNTKPLFDRVNSDYDHVKKKFTAYSSQFKAVEVAIIQAKSEYLPLNKEIQAEFDKIDEAKDNLNQDIGKLSRKLTKDSGAIETLDKNLKRSCDDLEKTKRIVASYGSTPVREIVDILNEHLDKKKNELVGYQKEDGIKGLLQENFVKQNKLNSKLKKLGELIGNSESTVLHQLQDTSSASILVSLNEKLARVYTVLDDNNKTIIKRFTELFGHDGAGDLTFLNKSVIETPYISFDNDAQLVNWAKEKSEVESELEILDKDIQKQQDALKHDNVAKLIAETEKEIKATSNNLKSVNGFESLKDANQRQEIEIDNKKSENTSNDITLNELKTKLSKVKGEWSMMKMKLEKLNDQKNSFEQIDNYLNNAKSQCSPIDCEFDKIETSQLTVDKVQDVWDIASKCSTEFNRFNNQLRQLLTELPHPDIDIHKEFTDINECGNLVQSYTTSFSTLDYDLNQHLNETRSHNQLVSNQLNELKEAKTLLTNFINEINKELNDKHVSNLAEIKLHLEMNKRFESLLATLEKHDIQDHSLLEDQFYLSLANFVETYFNKKTRRLKMHDIISSITYHYTLEETGEVVTKSQSGGTTSTITAFVLSVLLKRITPPYVSLRMPIIVDEISTLDFKNTDSTIKQIADHGFSIFCATPSFSAFVSQKVGRWIMIDRAMVQTPLVNKCHLNILPRHVESLEEIVNEA